MPKDDVTTAPAPLTTEDHDEAAAAQVYDATTAAGDSATSETGKLKMIIDLIRRSIGIKDIANMRLSLPAQLLEPIPNLEYWQYCDRPDLFAAINDSPDPLERMLAVLRFTFSKDLKYVRGRVFKPYNSVLGEYFRCHWDILPVEYPDGDHSGAPTQHLHLFVEEPEVAPAPSKSRFGWGGFASGASTPRTETLPAPTSNFRATASSLSLNTVKQLATPAAGHEIKESEPTPDKTIRVVYLTEQVSHHPPISAFYYSCPTKGIECEGIDQISANVSGMSVRIAPGKFNKGIFLRINNGPGAGESYRVTYPVALVNGILRGNFYITVGDSTSITCSGPTPGTKYRTVIEYKEESWLGKPQFLVEGVIHTYEDDEPPAAATSTPTVSDDSASTTSSKLPKASFNGGYKEHDDWNKVKLVPKELVVAQFEGCWKKSFRWRRVKDGVPVGEWQPLLDMASLAVFPKSVRPLEQQGQFESRKMWDSVTTNLLKKEYSEATKAKVAIEQAQRDRAAEMKRKGEEFVPKHFEPGIDAGWSELTEAGRKAVEDELVAPPP
ncbi:hypothetical protein BKA62DRAFT_816181 [Auriculariales sp. MPI-PUGE-AT-0066]|nr:hypothetical protein BKA62DRAFT_816181 [Auriculariales sp. MPI-PUGE-AT-0066]